MECGYNLCRACPSASNKLYGEPNTPFAFWLWDECHSKQQVGHGKIAVGIGQISKDSIFFVANYDICFMLIVSVEEQAMTLSGYNLGNCCGRSKITSRKMRISHRYMSTISSMETPGIIRQSVVQFYALHVGYAIDIVFPIFEFGSPYL